MSDVPERPVVVSRTSALWETLSAAGLTTGGKPAIDTSHAPWYVRVMLGIAGLIAAAFLLGFVGMAFSVVMESTAASVTVGLMLIAAAFILFRLAKQNDFIVMFALVVSFAGQALAIAGLFGLLESGFDEGGLPFWQIAALQAVLALVMPNPIHRTLSAYAAGLAFAYASTASGVYFVSAGVLAATVAALWLHEGEFGKRHAVAAPIAYGITMAFMHLQVESLFLHLIAGVFGAQTQPGYWPWAAVALTALVLVVTAAVLLQRAGWKMQSPRTLVALLAVVAICAASFKAPGIVGGLLIVLLGFSNGNALLVGAGIAALLTYMAGYYYLLETSLLHKSGVLLATSVALLALRWLMLSPLMRQEKTDA